MNFGLINFNFDYLEEKKYIGNQEYFKTKLHSITQITASSL